MGSPSYAAPGLTLAPSAVFSSQVQDLQHDLRALGYAKGPIDGMFGPGTANCVSALQYDLMNNDGSCTSKDNDGAAPVAVKSYNNGTVSALTGVVDQGLVACIAAMLADPLFPKLPFSLNPSQDNQAALAAVQGISNVPVPFLLEILDQESNKQHYRVPNASSRDNFVTVGLDLNNSVTPSAITSRGFGIGQFTLFHHPPTADEVAGSIVDPVKNVSQTVSDLLDKFNNYVIGPTPDTQADDRIHEIGRGPLRVCVYPTSDARYLKDCVNCMTNATLVTITAGVTPVYPGAAMTYAKTQYHLGSYTGVPVRANIPCDWPYAVRRYNGSGVNSYDYQAEVLQKIATTP
jgi:peptidoglycan hydrolase-like protein with peptidoglycan-binding domain